MPPAGFEPTILASERPQSHGLGRAATGIGREPFEVIKSSFVLFCLYNSRQTRVTNFVSAVTVFQTYRGIISSDEIWFPNSLL